MRILLLMHFYAFITYVYLAAFILHKNPRESLNRACAAFLGSFAIWSFGFIFCHDLSLAKEKVALFYNISSIGWISFSSFFLLFVLIFTEKKSILKAKLLYALLFIPPIILLYKQWTASSLIAGYLREPYWWALVWKNSVWVDLFHANYILFMGLGIYMLFAFKKQTRDTVKKDQARVMLYTVVISLVIGSITDVALPRMKLFTAPNTGDFTTLIWAFGVAYAMTRYKFMTITPATAADKILSTMTDLLILADMNGRIIEINKAGCKLLGYKKNKLAGAPISRILAKKGMGEYLLEMASKKEVIKNYELTLKAKNSEEIPALLSSSILTDNSGEASGIVCVAKDISAHKRAKEEALNAAREWQKIFDAITDFVFVQNAEFTIIKANKAFAQAIKMKPAEIVGKKCYKVLHGTDKPWPNCPFEKTIKDRLTHTEEVDDPNIGMPLLVTTSPVFDNNGIFKGSVHIAKDITAQKKTETELKNKMKSLETFHKAAVDRELRMIELKKKIKALEQRQEKTASEKGGPGNG